MAIAIPTGVFAQIASVKTSAGWRLFEVKTQMYVGDAYDSLYALGDTRVAYLENDAWGIMRSDGELLTPAKYRIIQPYSAGLAAVHVGMNHWAYVDTNGQKVINGPYRQAKPFSEATGRCEQPLAAVKTKRGFGYITPEGDWHIKPKYHEAERFAEGYALVEHKQRLRYINCKNEELPIEDNFEIASDFVEGFALIQASTEDGYQYGYVNQDGEYAIEPRFADAYTFREGRAIVMSADGQYGFIDTTGTSILPMVYSSAWYFNSGRAFVMKENGFWYLIDKSGAFYNQVKYLQAMPFHNGLAPVHIPRFGWSFIRTDGTVLTKKMAYDDVSAFEHGYAPVMLGDEWGFINREGKLIVDCQFADVGGVFLTD